MLQWTDEYAIGIEAIDEQHQKLFEIANRIDALLKDELITDKYDGIVHILDELKDYTSYHFKSEEDYMLSIGYKKFLSQKAAHDEFLHKFEDIDLEKIDNEQNEYLIGVLDFVYDWLVHHIIKADKLIAAAE